MYKYIQTEDQKLQNFSQTISKIAKDEQSKGDIKSKLVQLQKFFMYNRTFFFFKN